MGNPTCIIDGCDKASRSKSPALCPMHYHRQYRHGKVTRVSKGTPGASNGRRYKTQAIKGHPLAGAENKIYVHRRVLFDAIGPGVHNCHWCGTELEWFLDKGHERSLHVDHLNDVGDDNRIENLVPCCVGCNNAKAGARRHNALRDAGFWSVNDTVAHLKAVSQRRDTRFTAAT